MAGTATIEYALDTGGGLVERLGAVTTPSGGGATSAWYVRGWGGELARQTLAPYAHDGPAKWTTSSAVRRS